MNLNRWLSVILMMGLFLVLSPLGAEADPYQHYTQPNYHHPHGKAYGWHGSKPHGCDGHQKSFQRSCKGQYNPRPYVHHVYTGPPQVAYVAPVTRVIGIQPYPQPQPVFSQPAPGLHGQFTF